MQLRASSLLFYLFLLFTAVLLSQSKTEDWKITFERTEKIKHSVLLTRDLTDKQKVPDSLTLYTHGECSVYLLFTPEIILTFDTTEYSLLMRRENNTFQDYYCFLNDNDIVESFFMLVYDSTGSVVRLDRISTDININFGDVICSYFPDNTGRIISVIDWYCRRDQGKIVWYQIEYSGFSPTNISCAVYERD